MSRIVVQSLEGRRIVGQLGPGEDLLGGLLGVCRKYNVRAGQVTVTGVLQDLALANYDVSGKGMGAAKTFRGAVTLISGQGLVGELRGKSDLSLSVVISRQRDNGVELLGGRCAGARVVVCEFVVESMEDVLIRRDLDRGVGMPIIAEMISAEDLDEAEEPEEVPTDPKTVPVVDRPAGVQRGMDPLPPVPKREKLPEPVEPTPDPLPPDRNIKVGDVLEHNQFGRCEVQKTSGDEEFVTVRLRNNRLVRLSLDVLDLHFKGIEEGGRQVFTAVPAPR